MYNRIGHTPAAMKIKEQYPEGSVIHIIHMKGEDRYDGLMGKVRFIDDQGNIHGDWGGLSLIPGEDDFEKIE